MRLAADAEFLLREVEIRTLASLASARGETGAPELARFGAWLDAGSHPGLSRIAEAFALGEAEAELVALLYAQSLSEEVRRALAALDPGLLPLWLARRLIPDLRLDTLATAAPLRRFGLVEVQGPGRAELRLSLAEPIVDRLCGLPPEIAELDARLRPMAGPIEETALTHRLRTLLAARQGGLPPLMLAGDIAPREVANALTGLGLLPLLLGAADIPEVPEARARLARTWSREAALDGKALVVATAAGRDDALASLAEQVWGPVVIVGTISPGCFSRATAVLSPGIARQDPAAPWRTAFAPWAAALGSPFLRRLASQFRLERIEIDALAALANVELDGLDADAARAHLWHLAGRAHQAVPLPGCRLQEPVFGWEDLVLPPALTQSLRRIEVHVRHAAEVFDDWGFGRGQKGRGIAALFAGPPGTGKTLAAEVLASSLGLRLLTIDLSQVISKYIGETAKNVAAAFDLAECTGAVMVWNEGDAIWGIRGQVSSATDRHVNAETGDLLSRIEDFRGFTVVTTNLRHAIDPAFLRRFRFIADFPLPSEGERLALWQQAFPVRAPLGSVNFRALAALPLSGGSIRNVALGAAFQAAEAGGEIAERHIEAEIAEELRKEGQPAPVIDWRAS
ncbi:ATP-binding protein [Rhizobium sp. WYCCWR 11128]|uniref:ATP-binding protein n=1 Tax=Rhizobium sp. WYCCWR 11128 TaxID=2749832 RepID=UPI0015D34A36|nr:ATP-binding protein [Rhizobium sp. WYCCWR 11128]NYT32042.1 ATP-binding protein [Rhizobium sp. WYCCWR 11128]